MAATLAVVHTMDGAIQVASWVFDRDMAESGVSVVLSAEVPDWGMTNGRVGVVLNTEMSAKGVDVVPPTEVLDWGVTECGVGIVLPTEVSDRVVADGGVATNGSGVAWMRQMAGNMWLSLVVVGPLIIGPPDDAAVVVEICLCCHKRHYAGQNYDAPRFCYCWLDHHSGIVKSGGMENFGSSTHTWKTIV